ncbi:restriction endonuclease subunit S [Micrococcoides hystricis]|uniref:Restriction endonuclease subunit S n=1 Tax=Micrococcoides hystricis TaxID=1572761 RepID=A0ABV6PCX7_9MICC
MNRVEKLIRELCPNGVEYKMLGDIAVIDRGNGMPKTMLTKKGVGAIHYGEIYTHYGPTARETVSFVTPEDAAKLTVVQPGDVVITNTSENLDDVCSTVAWLGENAIVIGGHSSVIRSPLDPTFLAYWFRSTNFFAQKYKLATGAKVIDISANKLKKVVIPVPPIEVQREIVKILDLFTEFEAELEAELEARRKQYEHYRDQLLTFPENGAATWVELDSLVEYINGKAHEKLVHPDGSVPLITARFISRNGEANRWLKPEVVLTPALQGDVALVLSDLPNGRALARTFFVRESNAFAINQRVAILRVKDPTKLLPRFLSFVMDRNRQLLRYDNGTDQTHLKKTAVQKVLLPVPPIEVQRQIADVLDKFDALVNDLSSGLPAEIEVRRKQYEYYRDKLLTFKELQPEAA